jgi:L-alanine-DL-glutamate epimerase-like enolase superfamily enzyme
MTDILSSQLIAKVYVRVVTRRYRTTFHNPLLAFPEKNAVLVFVETKGGAVGLGEAWCDGASPASVVAMIERDLTPRVLGLPVSTPAAIYKQLARIDAMALKGAALTTAIGALDSAIWDAYAKALGQPLHRLLGGARDQVKVYGSSGLYRAGYGPDDLAGDMMRSVEAGSCGVKIKVGGASLNEDVARVRAVREAIGPDAWLMVDALFSQDVPSAIKLGKALAPFDVRFYEAPTKREDLRGWAHIRSQTGLALSGPEVEAGIAPFLRGLQLGIYDYLQADVAICGGQTELSRIAGLASAYYRPLTMHASGSAISFAHNAVAAAAHDAGESVEFHLLHQALFECLWAHGWTIADGHVHLPLKPGIGIELLPDDPILDERDV